MRRSRGSCSGLRRVEPRLPARLEVAAEEQLEAVGLGEEQELGRLLFGPFLFLKRRRACSGIGAGKSCSHESGSERRGLLRTVAPTSWGRAGSPPGEGGLAACLTLSCLPSWSKPPLPLASFPDPRSCSTAPLSFHSLLMPEGLKCITGFCDLGGQTACMNKLVFLRFHWKLREIKLNRSDRILVD